MNEPVVVRLADCQDSAEVIAKVHHIVKGMAFNFLGEMPGIRYLSVIDIARRADKGLRITDILIEVPRSIVEVTFEGELIGWVTIEGHYSESRELTHFIIDPTPTGPAPSAASGGKESR